jgi:hypothetical protein
MNPSMPSRDSERSTVAAALLVGTLGTAVLMVLPGLVGVLKHGYGFTDSQLGYLSFADVGGLTLGSAFSARLVGMGPRLTVRWGLLVAAMANGLAVTVGAYGPLLALRGVAGVGAGFAVAVSYVVLGQSTQVDRNFGYFLICQLLFAAAALQWMPALSEALGAGGMFALLAGLFAVSLLLTSHLPRSTKEFATASAQCARVGLPSYIALIATFAYFAAQGAVWAYLELIGERGDVARQTVATAVAVSALAALAGPAAAVILRSKFGRALPMIASLGANLFALYLLGSPLTPLRFILAACLFNTAWNLSVPYQLASIAAADPSGRVVGWAAPASLAGFAIGPPIAALAMEVAGGLGGVLWSGAVLGTLSVLGFVPVWASSGFARDAARGKQLNT